MPASDGEFGDDLDAAARAYATMLAERRRIRLSRHRFSTSICSAWAARAISIRCSRTPPRCARPSGWWSASTDSPKPPPRRITLTLPAVRRSRQVWLVVSGEAKADAVAAAVAGADPDDCAGRRRAWAEKTIWLLDSAAAGKLSD